MVSGSSIYNQWASQEVTRTYDDIVHPASSFNFLFSTQHRTQKPCLFGFFSPFAQERWQCCKSRGLETISKYSKRFYWEAKHLSASLSLAPRETVCSLIYILAILTFLFLQSSKHCQIQQMTVISNNCLCGNVNDFIISTLIHQPLFISSTWNSEFLCLLQTIKKNLSTQLTKSGQ